MELAEALATRRSVRKLAPDPVPREIIEELVSAATMAPNAHNSQPWQFVVVEEMREALVDALASSLRSDLLGEGEGPDEAQRIAEAKTGRFRHPPTLLLVCLDAQRIKASPRHDAERLLAVHSVAAAIQNLLLAAHDRGLATCWYCAPAFCPETVRKALDLSPGVEPQALVALGRPAEDPTSPLRRPLAEVLVWR
ncbi:MAG: nitroreductase family protein [Candidatus Undinarchaeales archaeon]|jgi:F420 biosynthesis protein FbiB-like protein|nr:nitroreductase family protein [Candidatus Undinarchaeales archaeon]MDP7491739.1 nitroreductase family protein [Candidatus Undinarchaeales archaeon]